MTYGFHYKCCTFRSWQSICCADKYADICHTVVFICEATEETGWCVKVGAHWPLGVDWVPAWRQSPGRGLNSGPAVGHSALWRMRYEVSLKKIMIHISFDRAHRRIQDLFKQVNDKFESVFHCSVLFFFCFYYLSNVECVAVDTGQDPGRCMSPVTTFQLSTLTNNIHQLEREMQPTTSSAGNL